MLHTDKQTDKQTNKQINAGKNIYLLAEVNNNNNGCDAPNASGEFPTPLASPPRPPTPPAAQVRQDSWHHYAKKKVTYMT